MFTFSPCESHAIPIPNPNGLKWSDSLSEWGYVQYVMLFLFADEIACVRALVCTWNEHAQFVLHQGAKRLSHTENSINSPILRNTNWFKLSWVVRAFVCSLFDTKNSFFSFFRSSNCIPWQYVEKCTYSVLFAKGEQVHTSDNILLFLFLYWRNTTECVRTCSIFLRSWCCFCFLIFNMHTTKYRNSCSFFLLFCLHDSHE